jgi:ribosomal protein L11 methyltransferase
MPWAALAMQLDAADADRLSDRLLEQGADSVTLEDADAGTAGEKPIFDEPGEDLERWPRLRLRFLAPDEATGMTLLHEACVALDLALPAVTVEEVAERDWVRASQAQFAPIQVSPRLWVVPSWHEARDPAAINLLLDPGLAFGTGSHPTTRLCLRWLEREVRGGERVLDYGCGSGILAIAAVKLGAGFTFGIDIDAAAVEAARANAALNGVECGFADAADAVPGLRTAGAQDRSFHADLIVANILANPLRILAPALAGHARPGGKLALAGLLTEQAEEVAACYEPWFDLEDMAEEGGWTRLSLIRRRRAA